MNTYRSVALPASAIADAIAFAVAQPPQVDAPGSSTRRSLSTCARFPPT
jgi:NADP-dependent 3-hydroxy acid dehydrogenase YdfG